MTAVILTVHTLIVIALIGVVLLQRSDGGALGLGGGAGGGFMSGRGAANALTRTTSMLAAAFFATSLLLAIRAGTGEDAAAVIEDLTNRDAETETADDLLAPTSTDDLLNRLGDSVGEGAPADISSDDVLDALGAGDALTPPGEGPADAQAGAESASPEAGAGAEPAGETADEPGPDATGDAGPAPEPAP